MTMRNPGPYDCGIYSITSPSGKMYIGSSNNIPKRWNTHKRELNKQTHPNRILQSAWNKYEGNLEFSKLLICEEKDLLVYEQQYLDFYAPSYNISKTADRPSGMTRTEEFRQKISRASKGNKYNLGKKASEETRRKVSQSLIGNKRASGKRKTPMSDEHKTNLSKAGMGHLVSSETRQKISEAFRLKREAKKQALENVL